MPGDENRALELPTGEVGHPDVAHLPGPDQVIEGGQSLFDRSRGIPAMRLVEVDVVGLEAPEAPFASADDPAPGQALGITRAIHSPTALGSEHDRVARHAMPA